MKNKKFAIVAVSLGFILAVGMTMNAEVSIRQGINGRVHEIKMPLYIKAMEFLSRHYEYQRITREIIGGCNSDEEKVLAILIWTHSNIRPTPSGFPVTDDHILNIIIRGYGSADQSQDVFTNLCTYAGFPSFFMRAFTEDRRAYHVLSFVMLNGKWRVFDAYNKIFFQTRTGEIASIEDLTGDKSIIEDSDMANKLYMGIPYKEFYYGLKPIRIFTTLRPGKQMPLKRVIFEIKRVLGMEKEKLEDDRLR